MGTGGQQAVRPIAKTFLIRRMEFCSGNSEVVKVASNIIQRDQAVVTIERGVFKPLRHDWTGELLEFHGESHDCFLVSGIAPFRNASEKDLADEIEDTRIGGWTSPLGCVDRGVNVARIGVRDGGGCDVGTINGKTGDHFSERVPKAVEREVAVMAFGERDARELISEDVEFAGQGDANDQSSRTIREIVEINFVSDKVSVDALE